MPKVCPICNSQLNEEKPNPSKIDATFFSCPLCGDFVLSRTLIATLPETLAREQDAAAKISHALRIMQQTNKVAKLCTRNVDAILKRPLPRPREQADLLIRCLAETVPGPGETVRIEPSTHRSIIGAKTPYGFAFVLRHLFDVGLVTGNLSEALGAPGCGDVTLSFQGWEYYEKLRQGGATHRRAFMAMKFGDADLDHLLETVLRPSVKQAGFELFRLDDIPRAGLIDDRLRVEIQTSDFLVADLTHDNPGAYWEAGYAEGLGKPVIYVCERNKFESEKTHFDTNHHLTVIWDKSIPAEAGDKLKATIRATLPHLAKMED